VRQWGESRKAIHEDLEGGWGWKEHEIAPDQAGAQLGLSVTCACIR